ncbi:MAG: hypothetical protein ACRDOL_06740 [Streptosporangiaceae bacterium]
MSENFSVAGDARTVGFSIGSRVAGYRLEEHIGSGGMAMVFRARDERLRRQVAIKILSPALAADEEFRRRFVRESRAAAAVDDPHIIPVFEAGEAEGVLFSCNEFADALRETLGLAPYNSDFGDRPLARYGQASQNAPAFVAPDEPSSQLNMPAKKHPGPAKTPTPPPNPVQATESPTPSPGQQGNPYPYPTYACDPKVVTCTPTSPSPQPSSSTSSGGIGGF